MARAFKCLLSGKNNEYTAKVVVIVVVVLVELEKIVTMVWNWLKQKLKKSTSRKIKELEKRIESGEFKFFKKLE
jgi:hypothetical protein